MRLTPGVCATPVPFRVTVCGEPVALSTTAKVAVRAPPAVGVKVVLNVQLKPESNSEGQLSLKLKSPALAPVRDLLLIVIVPPGPDVLVKVNDWLGDEVPTVCDAKVLDAGRNVAVNAAGTVA